MTAQIIHRADHNGIPVLWSDIRSTFSGALTFAVGVMDETPRTGGVTHLLEHLVMSQVGKVLINHNATTSDASLTFYAQGPAHLVADFLGRVATAILNLEAITESDVHAESAHIAAELGEGHDRTGSGPMLERYGAKGLGLLDLGAPAHRSLTRADAVSWGNAWLHAGNAVLTFSGPAPAELDVSLPPRADMPLRKPLVPLPYRTQGWLAGGRVPLAVSLNLTADDRSARFVSGLVLKRALFEELRERRHLVYSVDVHVAQVSPDTVAVTHVMDPQPDDILATAEATLAVVRGLGAEGPSQDLVDRIVEEWRNLEEDSDTQYAVLVGSAARLLRDGLEPLGVDHAPMATVTTQDVQRIMALASQAVLVSFGDFETDLTSDAISERLNVPWATAPEGYYESMGGRQMFAALMRSGVDSFDAKTFGGRRGQQLVVDSERLMLTVPRVGNVEVRWDELVLAGWCGRCGLWDLTDVTGEGVFVDPSRWRSGTKLAAKLTEFVPADVRYPMDHAAWH